MYFFCRFSVILLLFVSIVCLENNAYAFDNAMNNRIITTKKADFILEVASKISYSSASTSKFYRIGVYGRKKEVRELFEELEKREGKTKIHGKDIEVFNFRKSKYIQPVDVLYITGDSKIRLSELNKKLSEHPYIIITENFPFGTSSLNFSLNDNQDLIFELQAEAIKSKGATIDPSLLYAINRAKSEREWQQKLDTALKLLAEEKEKVVASQEQIIEQTKEIDDNERVINEQRIAIIVGIISLLIIIGLSLMLFKTNQEREKFLLELEKKNNNIISSLNYAQRIQGALLPDLTQIQAVYPKSFILFKPRDIVSGDFYWFNSYSDVSVLCVGDCTGHGVPGAFMSIMGNALLNFIVGHHRVNDPGTALRLIDRYINRSINQNNEMHSDGMDIAIVAYFANERRMQYAGANRPLLMVRNGELTVHKPTKRGIGSTGLSKQRPFACKEIQVEKGDCFYLLTDGYQDQFGGEKEKKFMRKHLYNLLLENHHKPMPEQLYLLDKNLYDWQGDLEQVDDICIVGWTVE